MSDRIDLRIKVREDLEGSNTNRVRVVVVDKEDRELGDLSGIVEYDGITYRLDTRGVSILEVRFAVERAAIDAIEVAGYNISRELVASRKERDDDRPGDA